MDSQVVQKQIDKLFSKIWFELDDTVKAKILTRFGQERGVQYKFDSISISSAEGIIRHMSLVPPEFSFNVYYLNKMREHNLYLIKEINMLKKTLVNIINNDILQN